jgi:hypothetical protein
MISVTPLTLKGNQSIRLRELLKDLAELRIVVARHCGEEMMLKLVMHATEEVLCGEVIATESPYALKVVRYVTVGGASKLIISSV